MKILICNDGYHAMYYIRLGLARAFTALGHDVVMWQKDQKATHDAFDELEPDLFIGQTYNLTDSIIEAIMERPHLKVICKAGDWGMDVNTDKYKILMATEEEKDKVLKLKEQTGQPEFLYIYYHPDYISQTHKGWIDAGISVHSIINACDVFDYTGGQILDEFKSDICFIGGYWNYKAIEIDQYLLPICNKYHTKIFGNSPWPIYQYCGMIPNEYVKHAFASSLVCPNLNEPHARRYGFDINERPFKLAGNKSFIISSYVEGLEKIYPADEIIQAYEPEEFHDLIEYYVKHPDERQSYIDKAFQRTMRDHTYFNRAKDILDNLSINCDVEWAKIHTFQKLGITDI